MGRYVYLEEGNVKWCWKFRFAVQCSNFGEVLDLLLGQEGVRVKRYAGEDGEYVTLWAVKGVLLEALGKAYGWHSRMPGMLESGMWKSHKRNARRLHENHKS